MTATAPHRDSPLQRQPRCCRFAATAMACRWELVLCGELAADQRRAASIAEAVFDEVAHWHSRLNRFASDSDLSQLNRAAGRGPTRLASDFAELLAACECLRQSTGGLFDIRRTASPQLPLSEDTLHINLSNSTATLRSGAALDLGGVAKGYAMDCCQRLLLDLEVTTALLHAGTSSTLAIGRPDSDPWQIAVQPPLTLSGIHPRPYTVSLENAHLSVSSHSGRPDGHIVDPRNAAQVIHPQSLDALAPTIAAVTASSGLTAEALSKAALLDPHGIWPLHHRHTLSHIAWHTANAWHSRPITPSVVGAC